MTRYITNARNTSIRGRFMDKDADSLNNNSENRKVIILREFKVEDFKEIQKLYEGESWNSIIDRPEDGLEAWRNSSLTMIAELDGSIIGLIRGFTDKNITTYIAELLVKKEFRGSGIGSRLINACHEMYPKTRIELMASELSKEFYENLEFREIYGFRKSLK